MEASPRDQNHIPALVLESSTSSGTVLSAKGDEITGRLLVDASGGGSGTVTSVSVVSANGFAGTVATDTTTPAITLSTTVTGVLYGNGTSVAAATGGQLPVMTSTVGGAVPTPPNNTTTFLRGDGTFAAPAGGGDVVGPGSSTDNALARFDLATGKLIQNSVLIVDDSGNIVGPTAGFKITGGTSTTADLSFQTTTGVGASGADMHFLVGNAGGTEAMTILNSGNIGINTLTPANQFVVGGVQAGNAGLEVVPGSGIVVQSYNRVGGAYASLTFDGTTSSFRSGATSGTWQTFRALTTTLAGATVGAAFDYSTGVTNAAQNFSAMTISSAAVTAANTNTLRGLTITPGAITNSAGTSTYIGALITMPNITQSGGTLTATGLRINGGTVTSGTAYGLIVESTAGNVGIGTATPTKGFEVLASTGFNLYDTTNDLGITSNRGANNQISIRDNTTDIFLYAGDTGTVTISTIANANIVLTPNGTGNVGIATATPDRLLHEEVVGSATATVAFGQRHSHITSGTAAVGFGIGEEYELENASGTNRIAGTHYFTWSDPVNATEDASWALQLIRAGTLTDAVTVTSVGGLTADTLTGTTSVTSPVIRSNPNSSLSNFGVNTAATIGVSSGTASLQFGGSSAAQYRVYLNGTTSTVLTAGTSYAGLIVGAQTATEATSGTHPVLANVAILAPVITNGTATTTDLTTLYIAGAPTGITPTNAATAVWVDSGTVRVDDALTVGAGISLLGGTLTLSENTSIALDPAGSADGKYTGTTVTGVAGYTQAFGDLVYLAVADSRWELADADAASTAGPVMLAMVVVAGTDGNACTLLLQGIIRADAKFPTMTVGATQYVGETAGAIQGTIPTGADNIIRTVGYALTADELYFNPSTDWQVTVA
jgi:hypothetical protein